MSDAREEASEEFMEPTASTYISSHNDGDGNPVCVLRDGLGDPVCISNNGLTPLVSWAFRHDIPLSTVH
jgi:hypothetical protein